MSTAVFFNNRFIDASEASLSISNGGWLHGAGLFETMRAENRHVFRFESHIERLRRSAERLLLPIDRGALPTPADASKLLERNGLTKARLRLTVSAGAMETESQDEKDDLTICLTATELTAYASDSYEKGIGAVVCTTRLSPTDPIAGHKTTGYLPRLLGLQEAQNARCVEALWFTTENRLAEGSISNVFVVEKERLKTPPLDTPVLPGITRAVVLEIAEKSGIQAEECVLTIDNLLDADEVFLTNSIMQVMPVTRVERHDIGTGKVGPMSRRLLEEYRTVVRKECRDVQDDTRQE